MGQGFPAFFNQGILPLGEDLEEERRLCYVAITRARKGLDMSSIDSFPRLEYFDGCLSEFLAKQPKELYKEEQPERSGFMGSCSEFGQGYWARMFGNAG